MRDFTARVRAALADRYDVGDEVGCGGMGIVFRAHDRRHDRPVAIKVLKPSFAGSTFADRFAREIRVAERLRHPHIVPLHD